MINTYNVKQQQLKTGSFKVGSGKEVVLIIGSCRSVMYVNYLNWWNESNGNRFTIHHIDPVNFALDPVTDAIGDLESKILSLETNEYLLNLFKETKIYIHEYYQHYGMFNSHRDNPKNIYQFGLNPELDICMPNFHDLFILFQDQLTFDVDARERARADIEKLGILSNETQDAMRAKGEAAIEKFYEVCRLSSVPEMEYCFKENYKNKRFFYSYNHVSKWFNLAIFNIINEKFLNLDMSQSFWNYITNVEDMFANPSTGVTQYDIDNYGFNWNEPIKDLMI